MKKILRLLIAIGIVLSAVSCNNDDKSEDDNQPVSLMKDSEPKTIRYINFERTQFVTTDGWVVNMDENTIFNMQRESCSGFNHSSPQDKDFRMSVIGAVQFEYDLVAGADQLGKKRVRATTVNVWRKECLTPTPSYVIYPDTDKDRYADHEDAFPNDPTKH